MSLGDIVILAMCAIAVLRILWALHRAPPSKYRAGHLLGTRCPACRTAAPVAHVPANDWQRRYGGWTCVACNLELDRFGIPADGQACMSCGYLLRWVTSGRCQECGARVR